MIEQLKGQAKTITIVGTLTLAQLGGWAMTVGEYKTRIESLERTVVEQRDETRDLKRTMDDLRIEIVRLRVSIDQQTRQSYRGAR